MEYYSCPVVQPLQHPLLFRHCLIGKSNNPGGDGKTQSLQCFPPKLCSSCCGLKQGPHSPSLCPYLVFSQPPAHPHPWLIIHLNPSKLPPWVPSDSNQFIKLQIHGPKPKPFLSLIDRCQLCT